MNPSKLMQLDERGMMFDKTGQGRSLGQLGETLDSVAKAAGKVIGGREADFLALGARLQEFTRSVLDLTRQASDLAELTSCATLERGAGELSAELERMRMIVSQDSSSQSLRELDSILEVSRKLKTLSLDFRRIVKKLQMLGISTRIESARLGSLGRGFTTLADDVEKLACTIISHSSQIADKAESLCELVASVRERTTSILDMQRTCSTDIFSCIEGNLRSLVDLTHKSAQISAGLPDKARSVSAEIGEVVSSLQFHDIVRQQVEHVVEALEESLQLLQPHIGKPELAPEGKDVVSWTADVCALQASQLHNAAEQFSSALERLSTHMLGIARHAVELSGSLAQSVSVDTEAGVSVLNQIEQGVGSITDSMREYASQGEAVGGIMSDVARTIAEMSSFVSDIEDVGAEIELIALNASVKAAHTGDEGRALGVLAQAIQHLSVEARTQTESVSSILVQISSASEALLRNADSAVDREQVTAMIGRMGDLTGSLRNVSGRVGSGLATIGASVGDLASSIEDTVEGLTFHHDVARELEASRIKLEFAGQEARRIVPQRDNALRSERLRAMLDRYTMDAERIIHMSAFGDSNQTSGKARSLQGEPGMTHSGRIREAIPSRGDDLGDNVELF